jgi:hypothetical protein
MMQTPITILPPHIIFISLPPYTMPINRSDKVITTHIFDPSFWATNPQNGELFQCPFAYPNCYNCIMITVWPEFRPNQIAQIKRFIMQYEMGDISTRKGAEALRPYHEPQDIMDFARWYLVQLQRFSVPSQVADTVKDLEWIVAHQKKLGKLKSDGWVQCSAS